MTRKSEKSISYEQQGKEESTEERKAVEVFLEWVLTKLDRDKMSWSQTRSSDEDQSSKVDDDDWKAWTKLSLVESTEGEIDQGRL